MHSPFRYALVWRITALLCFMQAVYAALYIHHSSRIVEGQRYFVLFDDALISMRYARHLANGEGLTWNPGERVEGYTNLGWTLIMALLHLPGWSCSNTCLAVQILGAVILWLCLIATAKLARAVMLPPVAACGAVVLTAAYYNLLLFSLSGMETALLCLLVTFSFVATCRSLRRREGSARPFIWLAMAVLVRPDALLIVAFSAIVQLFAARKKRWHILGGLLFVGGVLGLLTIWRWSYYCNWLPNTYYLKVTGWPLADRLTAGLRQALWTGMTLAVPFVISLTCFLRVKPWHWLLVGSFTLMLAYQTWVGGDFVSLSRFVVPVVPGLLVATVWGMEQLLRAFLTYRHSPAARAARIAMAVVVVGAINGPLLKQLFLLEPTYGSQNAAMNLRLYRAIEHTADRDASVAVTWAGLVPYFSDRQCYDLLGKCDPVIARMQAIPGVNWAGHNKHDLRYSISTHQPDLILHAVAPELLRAGYEYQVIEIDGYSVCFSTRRGYAGLHDTSRMPPVRAVALIREANRLD